MKNHRYVFFCALATLALTMRVDAQSLYASTAAGGAGELYVLNPANGSMVLDVGPLNDSLGANYGITGLAFNPVTGVLYGSTANSNPSTAAQLVSINYNSGLVTVIGAFNAGPVNSGGTPATMADLAFDAAGNLYGVGSIGGPQLYLINSFTGQATLIGGTGLTSTTGGGLAINSAGSFYGTPSSSRFGTYDSTLGTYANIANPTKPAGGAYASLSFDENGVLYGINLGSGSPPPTHLVTFDLATGAITDLGVSLDSIDAIAFQPVPVPEPGTLTLLGAGALALIANARRRKF
jgi:PEP-CTERM motif